MSASHLEKMANRKGKDFFFKKASKAFQYKVMVDAKKAREKTDFIIVAAVCDIQYSVRLPSKCWELYVSC